MRATSIITRHKRALRSNLSLSSSSSLLSFSSTKLSRTCTSFSIQCPVKFFSSSLSSTTSSSLLVKTPQKITRNRQAFRSTALLSSSSIDTGTSSSAGDGNNTIFGMILRGEIPCEFVYEDDQCVAFHDIEKQASTHILIIPRKHINRVSYAEKEDKELLGHLLYVASRIAEQEKLEGFRLLVNNGSAAGQTVFHLHVHLLGGEIRQALN